MELFLWFNIVISTIAFFWFSLSMASLYYMRQEKLKEIIENSSLSYKSYEILVHGLTAFFALWLVISSILLATYQ